MKDTASSRRQFLAKSAMALSAPMVLGLVPRRAHAADHVLKFGHSQAITHPAHKGAVEAARQIATETKGRLEVRVFPNSQLGGDPEMLSQVRAGALDLYFGAPSFLSSSIPEVAISDLGYAFRNYDQCWAAWDGRFGDYMRELIAKIGVTTFTKTWDLGFRQITSNAGPVTGVEDLKGLKIRIPNNPVSTSMFKHLGAAPANINLKELYTALQTRIVDAQENSLISIDTLKVYEVQKCCSMTNHFWSGLWIFSNTRNLEKVPADLRQVLFDRMNAAAVAQRTEMRALSDTLATKLAKDGLAFNTPQPESFRQKLAGSGYYDEWRKTIGPRSWGLLEDYVGKIG